MLRAKTSNGIYILGFDAENIKRLKDGKPILVSLAEMGGQDDVMIMFGETLQDIQNELEQITGECLPTPKPLKTIRNEQ